MVDHSVDETDYDFPVVVTTILWVFASRIEPELSTTICGIDLSRSLTYVSDV